MRLKVLTAITITKKVSSDYDVV